MRNGSSSRKKISTRWSPKLAYAIGLLTADGCLSKDGRHIDLTSKDREQISLFRGCLGLNTKISSKFSGTGNRAYHTQFGNVRFYGFLKSLGLTPAKSKTLGELKIPDAYFVDFLRGYFDGDGSSYSYFDPQYENSYRFYISFTSGSPRFIEWLQRSINARLGINGYVSRNKNTPYLQLKFAKRESILLSEQMYRKRSTLCLERKYLKIQRSLRIIERRRSGEIGIHAAFRAQFPQGIGGSNPLFGTK